MVLFHGVISVPDLTSSDKLVSDWFRKLPFENIEEVFKTKNQSKVGFFFDVNATVTFISLEEVKPSEVTYNGWIRNASNFLFGNSIGGAY